MIKLSEVFYQIIFYSQDLDLDCASQVSVFFGPRVYPKGSLVIALVRLCVRVSVRPSLNISETVH